MSEKIFIKEGEAIIEIPKETVEHITEKNEVFYNPKMRINRDLTVLFLRVFSKEKKYPLRVAEPLAASGIRSIRILKEVPRIEKVFINDLSERAVKYIKRNIDINKIPSEKYEIFNEEASIFLLEKKFFDYIDIDPFGSPVDFLDATAKSLSFGGTAGFTATDTAPLSATYPQTCLRRYFSKPLECEFYHEVGIRILINKIAQFFFQYDRPIEVLFSYSYLHHFRVFIKSGRGAKKANTILEKNIGFLLYCHKCLYRETIPVVKLREINLTCPVCGHKLNWAGPLWIGNLWSKEYLEGMLEESEKISISEETKKLLKIIAEESQIETVGFYTLSAFGKALKLKKLPSKRKILKILKGVPTHFTPEGFRTNFSHSEVLKIIKQSFR